VRSHGDAENNLTLAGAQAPDDTRLFWNDLWLEKKERTRWDSGCAKRENTFHPLKDQLEREQTAAEKIREKDLMIPDVVLWPAATSSLCPCH
jgi:hypothetical protein